MAFTIYADVRPDGSKNVIVERGNARASRQAMGDTFHRNGLVEDYQTAVCDDLDEVRSCLMRNFGIGFYNVARSQIADLAQAGGGSA